MKLRPEYQEIVDDVSRAWAKYQVSSIRAVKKAVERCQDLADAERAKPEKELSDRELVAVCARTFGTLDGMRGAIAAHRAKQLEPAPPVTVRLRMVKPPNARAGSVIVTWSSPSITGGHGYHFCL